MGVSVRPFTARARCFTDVLSARADIPWRKGERWFPLKTNTRTSKQIECFLTPPRASAVCVYPRGQPAGSTAAGSAEPAVQRAEPAAFLPASPAVARSQSLGVISWTLPFTTTADGKITISQKTSHGSSPRHPQPVGSRGSQRRVTSPAPHLCCRASLTCHSAGMDRARASQRCQALPLEQGTAAAASRVVGCGVTHYSSRMHGWSYNDFYQLENKTLNVQFPALKALNFNDISNVGLSFT